jgi:nucleotidyltransferase/DNA polymerase involved in DNA repair
LNRWTRGRAADITVVIACSKEAKTAGCTNVMAIPEARERCPDIIPVPQGVDLFRRAHNALLNEIRCGIPIEVVKSIDEMACRLDKARIADRYYANGQMVLFRDWARVAKRLDELLPWARIAD